MTTQPHAIPSKQDELYDIAAVHADDFREFASGHDIRPECDSCNESVTHVVRHGDCIAALQCDEHAEKSRRFVAHQALRGRGIRCFTCGTVALKPADVKVVPL